jgi:hypothetical protein
MHRILEASMLDCETIEEDVQFDDEWSIFKSITGRKKQQRVSAPHVASLFNTTPGSPTTPMGFMQSSPVGRSGNRSSLQVDTRADQFATGTPSRAGRQAASMFMAENVESPSTMIDILSGTLLVLELYEINPALIIQIFSQLLCWMAAEMFNGIMTGGKKYLSRSKALQIKMNLELIAEWVKASSLPSSLYTKHFERILQLLQVSSSHILRVRFGSLRKYRLLRSSQWLQCSSQLSDFDMLVATVPQLQSLNPLQLRRAVKDYRHEVNEPRMSEECSQYLQQLVRDWDRKRVKEGVEGIQREVSQRQVSRTVSPGGSLDETQSRLVANLDSLFDVDIGLSEYRPSVPKSSTTDLEDSRFNIPFAIPSQQFLAAVPTATKNMNLLAGHSGQTRLDGRPSSPASYSSSRPMGYTIRSTKQLQKRPDNFVEWLTLNQRAANLRLNQMESSQQSPRAPLASIEINGQARMEKTPERPSNVNKLLNRTSCE